MRRAPFIAALGYVLSLAGCIDREPVDRAQGALTMLTAPLVGSDVGERSYFGYSVAVDGDIIVVGAPEPDDPTSSGKAYVFVREGDAWVEEKRLWLPGATGVLFGASVAIAGETILVGSPSASSGDGAAYVYTRSGGEWELEQGLSPPEAGRAGIFGAAVALDGDMALVGEHNRNRAHVFVRSGTVWSTEAILAPSAGASGRLFGVSLDLEGDTAVVGGTMFDAASERSGAAWVFRRTGTDWAQEESLAGSEGRTGDFFGGSVSLSGETIAVGAAFHELTGAVYVFDHTSTSPIPGEDWIEVARILSPTGGDYDGFAEVALHGDILVVGASETLGRPGTAWVFRRTAGAWEQSDRLLASDGTAGALFGIAVATDGRSVVVGANKEDAVAFDSGAVYVHALPAPARIDAGVDPDAGSEPRDTGVAPTPDAGRDADEVRAAPGGGGGCACGVSRPSAWHAMPLVLAVLAGSGLTRRWRRRRA